MEITILFGVLATAFIATGLIFILDAPAMKIKHTRRKGAFAVVCGVMFLLIGCSVTVIPSGHTGVETTLGRITQERLPSGVNFHLPFVSHIEMVNNEEQKIMTMKPTWGKTKDGKDLFYLNTAVTYHISPERSAWVYENVDDYEYCLVDKGLIESAIKQACQTLTNEESVDEDMTVSQVAEKMQETIDNKYGEGVVTIDKVAFDGAGDVDMYKEMISRLWLAYPKGRTALERWILEAPMGVDVRSMNLQDKQRHFPMVRCLIIGVLVVLLVSYVVITAIMDANINAIMDAKKNKKNS